MKLNLLSLLLHVFISALCAGGTATITAIQSGIPTNKSIASGLFTAGITFFASLKAFTADPNLPTQPDTQPADDPAHNNP